VPSMLMLTAAERFKKNTTTAMTTTSTPSPRATQGHRLDGSPVGGGPPGGGAAVPILVR
jgi:hypothetical protein